MTQARNNATTKGGGSGLQPYALFSSSPDGAAITDKLLGEVARKYG